MQFAEMQIAAVAGQQLDVIGKTKNPELTYELKTASYTVRGPLLLGAEIAGASRSAMKTLDQFSLPTGIAFQLRDDLIGVFGTSDVTGKPQGGDLKEGKNTSLVREGKRRLKGKDKERVDAVLGNRRATDRQVQAAISALENCGAKQAVEGRILDLKTEAQETVAGSSLSLACKNLLQGAVVALADRRA
jgi:geranylgeranyl diphosphate synthase type I